MGGRFQVLSSLQSAWTTKVQGMQKINQAAEVHPQDPYQVIRLDKQATCGRAKLVCGPAVFKLCERAHGMPKMYVVVEGWICVEESRAGNGSFQTKEFATRVGYFRFKRGQLHHVYGVHYDMDKGSYGHPVFHAQLGPVREFASHIQNRFHLEVQVNDHVCPVLRNVRTPAAQMDFFSVFTQLCADHLMGEPRKGRRGQVNDGFDDVRAGCGCLQGAAHRLSFLNSGRAPQCYRSSHWYCRP